MKRARRLLWTVNGLLGVGIVVFASPAFTPRTDYLDGIDPDAALPSPPRPSRVPQNEQALLILRNPLSLRSEAIAGPGRPAMILQGALPSRQGTRGAAFLRTAGNAGLVVHVGERVPAAELQEWRLSELWKDGAAFTNDRGDRTELRIP